MVNGPLSFNAAMMIGRDRYILSEVYFADLPKKGEAQSEATIRGLVTQVSAR